MDSSVSVYFLNLLVKVCRSGCQVFDGVYRFETVFGPKNISSIENIGLFFFQLGTRIADFNQWFDMQPKSLKLVRVFLLFLALFFIPRAFSWGQASHIPDAYTWENLDWWQRVTVSYEAGSQTLSGRIGHGALQIIWFPATIGGGIGGEIADVTGITSGMGTPTMGEREFMAGVGITGDILGTTGIYVLSKLPVTSASTSLTVPEAAYVYGRRALHHGGSKVAGKTNALIDEAFKSGEFTIEGANQPFGLIEVSHRGEVVGRFPVFSGEGLDPAVVSFGKMWVEPTHQGRGLYTRAMGEYFRSNLGKTMIQSTVQNIPTVGFMKAGQRWGFDMSRLFGHSPLGRARGAWGFGEHFVTNWRTAYGRAGPRELFDVLSFRSSGGRSFIPPRVGLPGLPSQTGAGMGGGLIGCQGLACSKSK